MKPKPLKTQTTELGTWSVAIKQTTTSRGTAWHAEIGNHNGSGTYLYASTREDLLRNAFAWMAAATDPDPIGTLASKIMCERWPL